MIRRFRFWFSIALLVIAVLGFWRLRFDAEVLNLLPAKLPAVQGLKIYQEHFANARELVLTIETPDANAAENAARLLAGHLRLQTNLVADATWQPPWLEHPDQAAELIAYLWLNQPPDEFARLTNQFAPDALARAFTAAREQLATSMSPGDIGRLSYDPIGLTQLPAAASSAAPSFGEGQELFSSAEGTFRVMFVHAAGDLRSYRDNATWYGALQAEIDRARPEQEIAPDVRIGFTGGPAFVSEISGGMESDLTKSVGGAVLVIFVLFLLVHRRILPLLWMLALFALVLGGTLAVGGLLFGTVNVVSVGFAAILLGLSADYALVLYQEALHAPHLSIGALRRMLAPGILWSALTTCGAFLVLNLGDLPGLAQLGSLVAIGIVLAAAIMLTFFLPPLLRKRSAAEGDDLSHPAASAQTPSKGTAAWIATAIIAATALILVLVKPPQLDYSTNSLRPRSSPAYVEMEKIQSKLSRSESADWLLAEAADPQQLIEKLQDVDAVLRKAVSNGAVENYTLPMALLPNPAAQRANHAVAGRLADQASAVRQAAQAAGFTGASTAFTESVLNTWKLSAASNELLSPTNALSRWIFDKVIARDDGRFYALGLIQSGKRDDRVPLAWAAELPHDGVWVAGWERLGSDLLQLVKRDLWRVLVPIVLLLVISLFLAFRNAVEVLLSFAALAFSGLCLAAVMGALGWSLNLLNILALPLMLGAGVDYGIHMQLGLRRHRGNVAETRRTIGKALMLCAATTVAGFGSNAWSSNLGLASLGIVCAAGVALAYFTSCFLLPAWWRTFAWRNPTPPAAPEPAQLDTVRASSPRPSPPLGEEREKTSPEARFANGEPTAPSSLYTAGIWRLGLALARFLPRNVCIALGQLLARTYWHLASARREVVIDNLVPVMANRSAATASAKELFRKFAIKLVDLWRYEAGLPIENMLGNASGWDHFAQAQASGRGVLLLTPHLGNWEFGGPWMNYKNVKLLVLTVAEPGRDFTKLRQASRARWNIETLVVGDDPFGFLEIIKRLEAGATVALLVDRPPPATAVEVELFGKPFPASVAAAELARASGCVLLPVYIPYENNAYAAHILPAIEYDRPALRERANRQKLTQQIMRIFEPAIRQHLDQWFHFIPVWPRNKQ